jgi:hypothetical protein
LSGFFFVGFFIFLEEWLLQFLQQLVFLIYYIKFFAEKGYLH